MSEEPLNEWQQLQPAQGALVSQQEPMCGESL